MGEVAKYLPYREKLSEAVSNFGLALVKCTQELNSRRGNPSRLFREAIRYCACEVGRVCAQTEWNHGQRLCSEMLAFSIVLLIGGGACLKG